MKKYDVQVATWFVSSSTICLDECWIGRLQFYSRSLHFHSSIGHTSQNFIFSCVDMANIVGKIIDAYALVETPTWIHVQNGKHLSRIHIHRHIGSSSNWLPTYKHTTFIHTADKLDGEAFGYQYRIEWKRHWHALTSERHFHLVIYVEKTLVHFSHVVTY